MTILQGVKPANTYLYINGVYVDTVPFSATDWIYVVPVLVVGVNGFEIYVVDADGNRSKSVIDSVISLQELIETISFEKETLKSGIRFSESPVLQNLELELRYGTDPGTGKTITTDGFLQVIE